VVVLLDKHHFEEEEEELTFPMELEKRKDNSIAAAGIAELGEEGREGSKGSSEVGVDRKVREVVGSEEAFEGSFHKNREEVEGVDQRMKRVSCASCLIQKGNLVQLLQPSNSVVSSSVHFELLAEPNNSLPGDEVVFEVGC